MKERVYCIIQEHVNETSNQIYLDRVEVYKSGIKAVEEFKKYYQETLQEVKKRYTKVDGHEYGIDQYIIWTGFADDTIIHQGRLIERVLEEDD